MTRTRCRPPLTDVAVWAVVLAAMCALGCRGESVSSDTAKSTTTKPLDAPDPSDAVLARVHDLQAGARASEATLTEALTGLAASVDGKMAGLDHRFKSAGSLTRKIKLKRRSKPTVSLADVEIVDALRYTMILVDKPKGHYRNAASEVLAKLELHGETIVRVKNYWPKGDNYSGINVVLRRENQFLWELQFHTASSSEVANGWHDDYKKLRNPDLELGQRRKIFDRMTVPWNSVPIPDGILENPIHPTERKIQYPRP